MTFKIRIWQQVDVYDASRVYLLSKIVTFVRILGSTRLAIQIERNQEIHVYSRTDDQFRLEPMGNDVITS